MGAGRLSFNPKVMISRHQSSESEPIKNSQKLNQKLKISKKHFKNQLKLKESRSSSACGRLPGQKKKGSDFEDWWHEIIPWYEAPKTAYFKKKVITWPFTIIPTYFPSQSGRFSYQFFKAQLKMLVVWPLFKAKSIKTTFISKFLKFHIFVKKSMKIDVAGCILHEIGSRNSIFTLPGPQKFNIF